MCSPPWFEAYEREHFPIDLARSHRSGFSFIWTAVDWNQPRSCPPLAAKHKVNQVLSRQQPLSLEMIRRLHQDCQIAAEVLIQPYPLASLSASV